MKKLGVLVLGPGWVAGEHIKGYCENENSEIRSIVGTLPKDRDAAADYMEKFGFKADYSEDFEKELERDDIDMVSICLINNLHYANAMKAINAGKHVLVEKPLCFTIEELKDLKAAAEEKGVKTMVGHVARWYPAVANAHKLVDDDKLGEIFYGESDYWHEVHGEWKCKTETSGSSLLMGGCHSVDLLRWFMGVEREVVEVYAYSNGPYRRKDFDFDPNISGILKFKDGGIGKVGSSLETSMPYVLHYQFMGTDGCVRNNQYFLSEWGDKKDVGFKTIEGRTADDPDVAHHPFPEEVGYFVNCVANDIEPELSIANSYHTYEIVFAMTESAKTGKPVQLPM
ncbi:MAG: Gfo/Idh/MocA family oxidoreductase [Victivallales bacterium]|nr:Gfo/Idh/MocA family oxidoreductase [Victivallales bacterium]